MAYAPDQAQGLAVETVDLPLSIAITEAEIEIVESHLRDILIAMLQEGGED
ncbi:MAG: hypothetical protein SFV19_18930 [Rhodospirillaceae bacterium]|nr:hypothetical protein [Rhodospirillaceae bacterium]